MPNDQCEPTTGRFYQIHACYISKPENHNYKQSRQVMYDEDQQSKRYYKEFTCLDYFEISRPTYEWSTTVRFQEESPYQLPSVCIDPYKLTSNVYLLQWKSQGEGKMLEIKQTNSSSWGKISMNYYPSHVAITDERVFMFSKREVLIVPLLADEPTKTIEIEGVQIMDLKICYTDKNESGVYAVLFSQKCGYFSREFSKSMELGFWDKFKPYLNFKIGKYQHYKSFKIILPNIIGIGFLNDSRFIIYDLYRMQPAPYSPINLNPNSKANDAVVRWRLSEPNNGFNDKLIIYCSFGTSIYIHQLDIIRKKFDIDLEGSQPHEISLDRLLKGDIIDWSKSVVQFIREIVTGYNIIDFIIFNHEIIVRSGSKDNQQIPTYFKLDEQEQNCRENPFISQESEILKLQTQDKILGDFSNPSTLFYPNRYNKSMTAWFDIKSYDEKKKSCQSVKQYDTLGKKLQETWFDVHSFKEFIIINNRVYVARGSSITAFSQISRAQYLVQSFTFQDQNIDKSRTKGKKDQHRNQQAQFYFDRLRGETLPNQQREYNNIIREMKKNIDLSINYEETDSFKDRYRKIQPQFAKFYCSNLFKDKLIYYNSFIIYCKQFSISSKDQSMKNKFLIKHLKYFYQVLTNPGSQIKVLGKTIIDILIDRAQKEFTEYVELNIAILFKLLFMNLLGEGCSFKTEASLLLINQYLDFIIQNIRKDTKKNEFYQNQLKNFFREIVKEEQSSSYDRLKETKFNQSLFVYPSLFLGYFITHPKQIELVEFISAANQRPSSIQLIKQLNRIARLIPNQLEIIFKYQVTGKSALMDSLTGKTPRTPKNFNFKFNSPNLSSKIVMTVVGQRQDPSTDEGAITLAKTVLLNQKIFQTKSQTFEGTKKIILQDQERIINSDIDTFKLLQKMILQIYQRQCLKDIEINNAENILELCEILMIAYSRRFELIYGKLTPSQTKPTSRERIHLLGLLMQFDKFLQRYVKNYRILYNGDQTGKLNLFNNFQRSLFWEEQIFSKGIMESSITICNHICSQIWSSIVKILLKNVNLLTKLVASNEHTKLQSIVTGLLKQRFANTEYNIEDMQLLQFHLLKLGEKATKKLMKESSFNATRMVKLYEDRYDEPNYLLTLAQEQLTNSRNEQARLFINPYWQS